MAENDGRHQKGSSSDEAERGKEGGLFSNSSSSSGNSSQGGAWGGTWHSALASEAIYCLVSASTILFNKHALSNFGFPAPNTLLLFQVSICQCSEGPLQRS